MTDAIDILNQAADSENTDQSDQSPQQGMPDPIDILNGAGSYQDPSNQTADGKTVDQGMFQRISADSDKRDASINNIVTSMVNGDKPAWQAYPEVALKNSGILGDIVKEGTKSAISTANSMAPQAMIDQGIANRAAIANSPAGQFVGAMASKAGNAVGQFAQNHPNITDAASAGGDVLGTLGAIPAADAAAGVVKAAGGAAADAAGSLIPASVDISGNLTKSNARDLSGYIYDIAHNQGGNLNSDFTNKILSQAKSYLPADAADKAILSGNPIISFVQKLSDPEEGIAGKNLNLRNIDNLDKQLGNLAEQYKNPDGTITAEGLPFLDLQQNIRRLVANAGESDTASGSTQGFDVLKDARNAWAQSYKLGDIQKIQQRASMMPNPATAMQTGARQLLLNDKKIGNYDEIEKDLLNQVASPSIKVDALRTMGSRLGPAISGVLGGTIGYGLGGEAGAALGGMAAFPASYGATRIFANAADTLQARPLDALTSKISDKINGIAQKYIPNIVENSQPKAQQLLLPAPQNMSPLPMSDSQIAMAQAIIKKEAGLTGGAGSGISDTSGSPLVGDVTPQNQRPLLPAPQNMSPLPLNDNEISILQAKLEAAAGNTGGRSVSNPYSGGPILGNLNNHQILNLPPKIAEEYMKYLKRGGKLQ